MMKRAPYKNSAAFLHVDISLRFWVLFGPLALFMLRAGAIAIVGRTLFDRFLVLGERTNVAFAVAEG
jgi:hypothetical protein